MTSIEIHDDLRILRDLRTHISWRPEAPLETFGTKVLCRGSPGNQKTLQGIGIYSVDFECGINKIIYLGSYLYPGSKSLCYPIKPIYVFLKNIMPSKQYQITPKTSTEKMNNLSQCIMGFVRRGV